MLQANTNPPDGTTFKKIPYFNIHTVEGKRYVCTELLGISGET